jgi:hypothetical protein
MVLALTGWITVQLTALKETSTPVAVASAVTLPTTGTDTCAALQAPGAVGLTAYLSSSVTNVPVTVRLSTLSARPTA